MAFWEELTEHEHEIRQEWDELWQQAGDGPITQTQALRTLDCLWKRSHLDIMQRIPRYQEFFPTKQFYTNRLKDAKYLWWLDHATGGVNGWGTLAWFSSKPQSRKQCFKTEKEAQEYAHKRKGTVRIQDGKYWTVWQGYAGASTHFVLFANGLPFQLIPLTHGCWGEPKRNSDSIQIEMVNALTVQLVNQHWHYWAGPVPQETLAIQPPELLGRPYRGATAMLPYTWQQVISNIKLKRLCIAAYPGRFSPHRMSEHAHWNEGKFDMGPLWPFELCNKAAFENFSIEAYSFMELFVHAPDADEKVDHQEIDAWLAQEHATEDEDETEVTLLETQQQLLSLYGPNALPIDGADGKIGPETAAAVLHFQENWNRHNPKDLLAIDGIAGIQTQRRLQQALKLGGAFKKIPV